MANITTNAGNDNSFPHPVIVISNDKGNKYTSKVIIVAIEGDGSRINSAYQMCLSSADLLQGHLNKDPSRIILSEILTIDKTRLAQKIGLVKPDVLNSHNIWHSQAILYSNAKSSKKLLTFSCFEVIIKM